MNPQNDDFLIREYGDPRFFLYASRPACSHKPKLFLVRANYDGGASSLPPRSLSPFFHTLQISLRPSYAVSYMSITEEFERHLSTPLYTKEK